MNKDARTHATSRSSSKRRKALATPRQNPSKSSRQTDQRSGKAAVASARRTWIVLAGLVGALAITGALLKILAPPPLAPDATASLFAVSQEESIARIFDTPVSITSGRWRSIYVHQSLTSSGNALTLGQGASGLADHFLIGNGDPLADGAIQTGPRWSQQLDAGNVPGVNINPGCLSICVVGDFNLTRPTPTQQTRLVELIGALQKQLGIPADQVVLGIGETSVAGIGPRFPITAIRSQLRQ